MTINYKDHFTFNQYGVSTLTEKEWNKDVTKHYIKVKELSEIEVISNEDINELLNNNYSFSIVVKNDNPYFHKDCYMVDLYFNYCSSKPVTVYINKEYLNNLVGNKPEIIEAVEETTKETNGVGIVSINNKPAKEDYQQSNSTFKVSKQKESILIRGYMGKVEQVEAYKINHHELELYLYKSSKYYAVYEKNTGKSVIGTKPNRKETIDHLTQLLTAHYDKLKNLIQTTIKRDGYISNYKVGTWIKPA